MDSDNNLGTADIALPLLHEKRLPNATHSVDLVAYCDAHDLIALVPSEPFSEVVVYRLNGQNAFAIKRKNGFLPVEAEVTALKWKPDGACLAVGWADGVYGVYSGENGRVLSLGSVRVEKGGKGWGLEMGLLGVVDADDDDDDEEGGVVVSAFGWENHMPGDEGRKPVRMKGLSTEEWYDGVDEEGGDELTSDGSKPAAQTSMKDLSRAITTLDVTKVLPRLSAIPSHGLRAGEDTTKFVSQAAADGIFETQKDETNEAVDVLLVCGSDGTTRVLLDGSVNIGTCNLDGHPIRLASSSRSPTHTILSRTHDGELNASFIDLPLEALSGPLLHVIATNTKRLQNLLAYTNHTIRCITHDLTTGLQFPTRLLKNMNEELSEKQEGEIVTNLYHLAMTSSYTPTMLEWLVDIVKETNHKRWDQAINGMYANIQNHLFINLLPALDRLSIATTTLRGHARFHEGSSQFDVPPPLFTRILDGIDSIRLVAQKVQLLIAAEQKQFRAYSKWVRVMIEIGVAGPGTKGAIEVEEREVPNLDYPLLLAYMEKTLTKSRIVDFVEPTAGMKGTCESEQDLWQHPVIQELGYKRTVSALGNLDNPSKKGETLEAGPATNLPTLAIYLSASVRAAVESITAWQSRMLVAPTKVPIFSEPETRIADLAASASSSNTQKRKPQPTNLLVLPSAPENGDPILIHPLTAAVPASPMPFYLDESIEVLDAAYHPHAPQTVVLLTRSGGSAEEGGRCTLHAMRYLEEIPESGCQLHELHSFPASSFTPERVVVGGRVGRVVCVVIGNGGRSWQVLDLRGA